VLPFPPGLNYTEVILGYDQPALRAAWAELQESLEQAMMAWLWEEDQMYHRDVAESRMGLTVSPYRHKTFRVLIASYVEDSEEAADRLQRNLERLQDTRFNDTFEVAMFLYDGTDKNFRDRPWYADPDGLVVMRETQKLCKAEALYLITPDLASNYSHIWLLDGGLSLDMFSWSLYHTILAGLEPLVSLPAILPRTPEAGAPGLTGLDMSYWADNVWNNISRSAMAVTVDAARSDASCTVLASQLWPLVYNRLALSDRSSDEYLSDAWDVAAMSSPYCFNRLTPLITLVVASPVRVMSPTAGPDGQCNRGCGDEDASCLTLSPHQWNLTFQGINESVRWKDVDCLRNTTSRDHFGLQSNYFFKKVRMQCDLNFKIRGCRYFLNSRGAAKGQAAKLVTLYNGKQVWTEQFQCLNVWPAGMVDGECKPVKMIR
jgi:hypothetical protein